MRKTSLALLVLLYISSLLISCGELVTIAFDPNGGVGEIEPIIVKQYHDFTTPQNLFTRSGYSFLGWMNPEFVSSDEHPEKIGIDNDFVAGAILYYENDTIYADGDCTLFTAWGKPLSSLIFDSAIQEVITNNEWVYVHEIRELNLSGKSYNNLTDPGIDKLNQLWSLILDNNNISDISDISGFIHLTTLKIENNSVSILNPLSELEYLSHLELANNLITNVEPLKSLTSMVYLDLQDNIITTGVTSLSSLTNAQWIDLSGNPGIPSQDLDELEAAMPNTIIFRD